jgi:uncharacterized small protein (DUF1192 family)
MSDLDQRIDALKAQVTELKAKYPKWKEEPVAEVDAVIAQLKALIKEKTDAEKKAKKATAAATTTNTGAASSSGKAAATNADDDEKALLAVQHKKDTQFNEWYSEIIYKTELISNYPVSGCYM